MIKKLLYIALFAALIIAGAYIRIPLPAIPITLQTFFIFLAALCLGYKALLSIGIYLTLGLIGLPVFARGGAGLGYMLGPTGGFLFAFLVATLLVAMLRGQPDNIIKNVFTVTLATICIYILGTVWFSLLTGNSFFESMAVTVYPFIPGGFIKIVAAVLSYRTLKPLLQKEGLLPRK